MATLANLRTYTRTYLNEDTEEFFLTAEIDALLNEAQFEFCSKTDVLKAVGTISTVASVRDYALPTQIVRNEGIVQVLYDQELKLQELSYVEFYDRTRRNPYQSGQPEVYCVFDGRLHIWPVPDTSYDAATTTLGAAIADAVATTATVADNSVFPHVTGRFIVGTEVIEFRGISGTTTLSNLRRGLEDTTAAAQSNGATITERDLWLVYVRKPATITASVSTEIPGAYDNLLTHYAAGKLYMKRGDKALAELHMNEWRIGLDRAVTELKYFTSRDRYPGILPENEYEFSYYGRV